MGDERALETVKRMWIDYREHGVERALAQCHADVVFQINDGRTWSGHDGIRAFFAQFEDESDFLASPYTFEPCGAGVIVAGHRRVRGGELEGEEYTYFSHHVDDGLIVRMASWDSRAEATADLEPATT